MNATGKSSTEELFDKDVVAFFHENILEQYRRRLRTWRMHNRKHQKRAVRRERAKGERKNEQELIQQIEEKLANEAPPKGVRIWYPHFNSATSVTTF